MSHFASFSKHLLVKLRFKHILILISQYNVKTQDSQNGNMPQNNDRSEYPTRAQKRFKSKYLLTYTNFLTLSSRIIEVLIEYEYIKHLRSLSSVKKQQQTLNFSLYEAHNMVVVNNKRKKPEIFGGGCKNSDSSGED